MKDTVIFIWMMLISFFCIYTYIELRNIKTRLIDENNDMILSVESKPFKDTVLDVILSNLSYKKQNIRLFFSVLNFMFVFAIYGILKYFNYDKTIFIFAYLILLIIMMLFRCKMLNEVLIEEYVNKLFEKEGEDIKRHSYDYKKIISLEKDTLPLIALLFSAGICLLKELLVILFTYIFTNANIPTANIEEEISYLIAYSIWIYILCIVFPNYVFFSIFSTKLKDFLDRELSR